MRTVADVGAAIAAVGLSASQRVAHLQGDDLAAFRLLVGWDADGPVVEYPTPEERAARTAREAWKAPRLGRDRERSRLLFGAAEIDRARVALAAGTAPLWLERLLVVARDVSSLSIERLLALIPDRVPWNGAGSFCPACFGDRSDVATHAPFWRWRVDDPESITCPHCDIRFPHADYPEEGRLDLPRLGLSYAFYLRPAQRRRDWRDGVGASSFGGGPTHVSLSGEAERCGLNWLLGQLEPMALAAAVSGDTRVGDTVRAVLLRLARVYPGYPLYTYRQEYYDCDPAYAVEHCDEVPTAFRRAACIYTYCGRFGDAVDLHGRGDNTVGTCRYPNAEWGCSRLAREKASHGQLFLSLLHTWDLVAAGCSRDERDLVERDLLLEYYLDVKGLTKRIDNKSGPGTAARVAAGLMWEDEAEIADGVDRFHRLLATQFHDDGSWKETPIYGAKALVEGLWEIPELLRQRGMYDDTPLLRRAFEVYAATATPCGTLPSLDDSAVDFSLPAHLRDLARMRLGVQIPAPPTRLQAFGGAVRSGRSGFGGYVPRLDMVPDGADPHPGDGGLGFCAVGHFLRETPAVSWVPLLCGEGEFDHNRDRPALNRFLRGRGLACIGFGQGPDSMQLYLDGGDTRGRHRHMAPLSLMGFCGGREVFPDLGYIADHPANAWIRATASHNTVLLDGRSVVAAGRCELAAFVVEGDGRFVDLRVPVRVAGDGTDITAGFRRALLALSGSAGPVILVDVFDAQGEATFDYVCRAGAPGAEPIFEGLSWLPRPENLFADTWPTPPSHVHSAGSSSGFGVLWPGEVPVGARIVSASEEVISFRSPAWRTQSDTFDAPDLAWTAILCRRRGPQVRFVTVFALGGPIPEVRPLQTDGDVSLEIHSLRTGWRVDIGDASVTIERLDE